MNGRGIGRVAIAVAALLFQLACVSTPLAPGGEKVRVSQDPGEVRGCRALGAVVAKGPFAEPDEWKKKFQNEGLRLGADTVLLTAWSFARQTFDGTAYSCGQAPAAPPAMPPPPPEPAPAKAVLPDAPPPIAPPAAPAPGPDIVFRVSRSGEPQGRLGGIEASVVAGDGRIFAAGKTDAAGELRFSRSLLSLSKRKAVLVLFCGPDLFCGAVRVREENLETVDEFAVELSPRAPR